jgi:uridine kinase
VVAFDGNSGAFKTTAAEEVAGSIRRKGGKAVVISRDWFIDSRENRYARQDAELSRLGATGFSLNDNEISLRAGKFEEALEAISKFNAGRQVSLTLDLSELYAKYEGGGLTRQETITIDRSTGILI